MFKQLSLTPYQRHVLLDKGTDQPIMSDKFKPEQHGTFLCRLCGYALFRGLHQFQSSCGWPSFDNEITKRILRQSDQDGNRTEIICQRCKGHLGHVFEGEYLTKNNLRHCVNSTSLDFVDNNEILDSDEIIIAGGCFWGIEHILSVDKGVIKTESGYIGGKLSQPTYRDICTGDTGHFEAVRVLFDTNKISIDKLYKIFFESHNPFQFDGQGVNKGSQYQSGIFAYNDQQKASAQSLISELEDIYNKKISTLVLPVTTFWPAEESHQEYFKKNPNSPICHIRKKLF